MSELNKANKSKIKVLLHVCCGPCAVHPIEDLIQEYEVTLFYSNSNIYPREEYDKRLSFVKKTAEEFNVKLFIDSYDHQEWLDWIKGFENEPEKGKRCEKCFEFNLNRTAIFAKENDFDCFTTTLTVSPHKSSKKIFEIGNGTDFFLEKDFKKKDGFKRSI
ncbi:MAG: hypothetical protein DRI44_08970, partial [Chlamydiae bacterium]